MTAAGKIKGTLETLAHELRARGDDWLLGELRQKDLRTQWDAAFEHIPPAYWQDLRTALMSALADERSLRGLILPTSPVGSGVFQRARLEALNRLMAPERLQMLATLTAHRGGAKL
ncbi:hypothetical protein AA0488_2806 [Kozakia baliensis NRIC 0488]|uniref:Uncharacterized protein n=1 Tax=Kozakia baliensis TaxID=153496 RepID=A0A1D8UXT8_9PROT|nr:hypothetical protein [Kozakia baliensis]AOX18429.1 hypothetical protein A0U89_14015 [Kozakia baliensis]GBR34026.1 hypothetical protein AA0488_2806 [Kozakia baliensis NRIC 0488]